MDNRDFGAKLKEVRLSAKRTVTEISAYLTSLGYKASEKTIYSWEAGRSQPTPDAFLDMCKFYETKDVLLTFGYKKGPSLTEIDSLRSTLLQNFDQLNQEGRERLVEASDDMVKSGKYIKSDSVGLGKEA